jgi:hypothetical protein
LLVDGGQDAGSVNGQSNKLTAIDKYLSEIESRANLNSSGNHSRLLRGTKHRTPTPTTTISISTSHGSRAQNEQAHPLPPKPPKLNNQTPAMSKKLKNEVVLTLREGVDTTSFSYLSDADSHHLRNAFARSRYAQDHPSRTHPSPTKSFISPKKSTSSLLNGSLFRSKALTLSSWKQQKSDEAATDLTMYARLSQDDLEDASIISAALNFPNGYPSVEGYATKSYQRAEASLSQLEDDSLSSLDLNTIVDLSSFHPHAHQPVVKTETVISDAATMLRELERRRLTPKSSHSHHLVSTYSTTASELIHEEKPSQGLRSLIQSIKADQIQDTLNTPSPRSTRPQQQLIETHHQPVIREATEEVISHLVVADNGTIIPSMDANTAVKLLFGIQRWLVRHHKRLQMPLPRCMLLLHHLESLESFHTEYFQHEQWLRDKAIKLARHATTAKLFAHWSKIAGVGQACREFIVKSSYRRGFEALRALLYQRCKLKLQSSAQSYCRVGNLDRLIRHFPSPSTYVRKSIYLQLLDKIAFMFVWRRFHHRCIYQHKQRIIQQRRAIHIGKHFIHQMQLIAQESLIVQNRNLRMASSFLTRQRWIRALRIWKQRLQQRRKLHRFRSLQPPKAKAMIAWKAAYVIRKHRQLTQHRMLTRFLNHRRSRILMRSIEQCYLRSIRSSWQHWKTCTVHFINQGMKVETAHRHRLQCSVIDAWNQLRKASHMHRRCSFRGFAIRLAKLRHRPPRHAAVLTIWRQHINSSHRDAEQQLQRAHLYTTRAKHRALQTWSNFLTARYRQMSLLRSIPFAMVRQRRALLLLYQYVAYRSRRRRFAQNELMQRYFFSWLQRSAAVSSQRAVCRIAEQGMRIMRLKRAIKHWRRCMMRLRYERSMKLAERQYALVRYSRWFLRLKAKVFPR